jgi:hypothetical protein
MSIEGLEMTTRGTESGGTATLPAPPTGPSQSGQESAPPPPVITPTPEPKVEVTPSKPDTFMADLVKNFEKSVPQEPEPPAKEPPPASQKPPEPPKEVVPPPDAAKDEFGLPEPPKAFTESAKRHWKGIRDSAHQQIQQRENRIKDLERELSSHREALTTDQTDLGKVKEQLAQAQAIIEQTAIERSPVFKEKVLDQEEVVRTRLSKEVEGTSVTPNDVARLINGDTAAREEILEGHNLSAYRKAKVIDWLNAWDKVQDNKNSMLANGRQSREAYLRRQQEEADARKAQFMRESTQFFEDEMTTFAPTLEPYQRVEGDQSWNQAVDLIKTYARKIFNGNIEKKALAQAAIMAPAAAVYHKIIVPNLIARVRELEGQVNRMRGVSPTVADRGGDQTEPSSLSSPSGDFVKNLVERFRKESGT